MLALKKFEERKKICFKLKIYENKKITFYFITIKAQDFFFKFKLRFFSIIFDVIKSDLFVIIENSFSIIIVITFIQSVSVKSTLINSIFNVADFFLEKKNDPNKKIHVEESIFFFNSLILI